MTKNWPVQDAKSRFSEFLDTTLAEGPQILTRGGVDIAVLVPIEQWRKMERMTRPDLKELLLASEARTEDLTPPRRRAAGIAAEHLPSWTKPVYLLDTNAASELRRPRPHGAVPEWIADVPAEQLFVSAVTVGDIQAGIEISREQDPAKAEELETWLDKVLVSYGVLPMDGSIFREWARLMHGRSDTMTEDAMIAATAKMHRLTVVTRNVSDFDQLGVELTNPFEAW